MYHKTYRITGSITAQEMHRLLGALQGEIDRAREAIVYWTDERDALEQEERAARADRSPGALFAERERQRIAADLEETVALRATIQAALMPEVIE